MTSARISAARKYAVLTRHRPKGDPEITEAKREHAAASIEEYVAKIVASAPPLTEAQKARISALLGAA